MSELFPRADPLWPAAGSAVAIVPAVLPAAYFAVDAQWRLVYIDDAARTLLEASPPPRDSSRGAAGLLGAILWQAWPTLTGGDLETCLRATLEDGHSRHCLHTPAGQARPYEVICCRQAHGLAVSLRADLHPPLPERQQRIDHMLHESQTRFRLMTSAIAQIVWIADADGSLEFINDQWRQHTGEITPEGLGNLEAMIARHIHPEDQSHTLQAWQEARSACQELAIEHRIGDAHGQYRWFLTRGKPQLDAGGRQVLHWYGTSIDIHVQKQAIAELARLTRESEQRRRFYETFLSTTPDLAYAWDLHHRFTYANRVLLQMWGKTWDEAIGKNCLELGYEPWHAEMHSREIEQVRATKRPVRGDVPFNGTFGRRIYDYILFPVLGPDGEVEAVAGTTRDVTERKNSEARQHALFRLAEAIRAAESLGAIASAAAHVIGEALTARWVSYKSLGPAQQVDELGQWTFHPEDGTVAALALHDERRLAQAWRSRSVVLVGDVASDARAAALKEEHLACGMASYMDVPLIEGGELVGIVHVSSNVPRTWTDNELNLVREVSQQTRAAFERIRNQQALAASEARLREINESLEAEVSARTRELMATEEALRHSQKIEAIGQLTGGLAHDFNNLLGGITGSLDLMRVRLVQGRGDELFRYIDLAARSAQRAASLTQRLLAFARRQTLAPRATSVNALIGGMEELIRRTIGPSISLEVVTAVALWPTFVDGPQLESALLNLCINARDAMPEGGRLTIETANKWLEGTWAQERDLAPGQYVCVSVTDNGTGMPPDVLARAFDPFFTTKPLGEGTGLGLSMVYGFARQSGGQVRLYSEVGQGSTVSIYLPRHQDEIPTEEAELTDAPAASGSGEVVLVVDDEAPIRLLAAEVLNEAGYTTLQADDGPAALRILHSAARIDLLITDVGLPGGLNGRQVADAARATRPQLQVLFITGYAENAAFGNGHLPCGMQLLTKPFKMDTLARRVQEILESRTMSE
ncbi:multi-sensor hybrid histidine kinase [Herbaspirillum sp. GW103]|uniref:PAS domain-containing hybrid sensor histidine kinase/response regulator n=1 Tax=Herbaspirillum sp. GW103 TaxID=1175306 RepID=UPI00025E2E45|nr:ATP-binding protein [Herbaspirillum sp. GW103]EIJ48773.1 multi-sensor hybrid histidine kinase [Herbaspirillum sp. GW103]